MSEKLCFESVSEGDRVLCRKNYSNNIVEDFLLERSPSGEFYKFKNLGWLSKKELSHFVLLEIIGREGRGLNAGDSGEPDMCPNCLTPWNYNSPHVPKPCRGAPGGSPQLERYLDALGLYRCEKKDRIL